MSDGDKVRSEYWNTGIADRVNRNADTERVYGILIEHCVRLSYDQLSALAERGGEMRTMFKQLAEVSRLNKPELERRLLREIFINLLDLWIDDIAVAALREALNSVIKDQIKRAIPKRQRGREKGQTISRSKADAEMVEAAYQELTGDSADSNVTPETVCRRIAKEFEERNPPPARKRGAADGRERSPNALYERVLRKTKIHIEMMRRASDLNDFNAARHLLHHVADMAGQTRTEFDYICAALTAPVRNSVADADNAGLEKDFVVRFMWALAAR